MLAAGAVIASLLAKPVFHAGHPHGLWQVAGTVVGLLGCAGVLLFVVLLLRPYSLGFSVKPGATYRAKLLEMPEPRPQSPPPPAKPTNVPPPQGPACRHRL